MSARDSRTGDANDRVPALRRPADDGVALPAPQRLRPAPVIAAAPSFQPIQVLKALRRCWLPASLLGLVLGTLTAVVAYVVLPPASYTARAILLVTADQRLIFQTAEAHQDASSFRTDQANYLTSRSNMIATLRENPELAKLPTLAKSADPAGALEKLIRVNFSGSLMRVEMDGRNREDLPKILNAVVKSYLEGDAKNIEGRRQGRYDELMGHHKVFKNRLGEKKQRLKKLADELGTSDTETAYKAQQETMSTRAEAERLLNQTRVDLNKAKAIQAAKAKASQKLAGTGTPISPIKPPAQLSLADEIEKIVANDPGVQKLTTDYAALKESFEQTKMHRVRKANDPALQGILREMNKHKEALEQRKAELRPLVKEYLEREGGLDNSANDPLSQEIAVLEELERITASSVASYKDETKNLNQQTWTLDEIQSEIAEIDSAAKAINAELEKLNVELDTQPRVTSREQAEVPPVQADKRPLMAGVAGLGVLGLSLFGFSFFEYQRKRIGTPMDVTQELGLRLVGSLPSLKPKRGGWLMSQGEAVARQKSVLLESVDSMRAVLLRMSVIEGLRSVMVTSANQGEGKTSLACHLSSSLARSGRRTLLIDGDLRKPSVHKLFDLYESPGLAELLVGEADLEQVLQPGPAEGLWVITAGSSDPISIEALALPEAAELFERLKQGFDFVVLDSPPVLPVADTLQLGQLVDGSIFSILSDVSRGPKVQTALDRLRLVGVRNLGAVLAGVRSDAYGSSYSYAYAGAKGTRSNGSRKAGSDEGSES